MNTREHMLDWRVMCACRARCRRALMRDCWLEDADARPSFAQIVQRLTDYKASLAPYAENAVRSSPLISSPLYPHAHIHYTCYSLLVSSRLVSHVCSAS